MNEHLNDNYVEFADYMIMITDGFFVDGELMTIPIPVVFRVINGTIHKFINNLNLN